MSSDSAHQPLYLRASNVAQASDDDVGFWLSLQERMASSCSCDDREDAAAADDGQSEPEDDAFWLALQDEMASHINEDATDGQGQGQEIEEHVFADLMGYPQKPRASWLQGFAGLDDAFSKRGEGGDRVTVPDLVPAVSSDSETEPETDDDDDDDSVFSSLPFASDAAAPARRGVSFSSHVEVRTIPHRSSLSSSQRRRMYCSSVEIHRNKQRNRKEFRYDGCDWRNATEECDMGVDAVTGELVHPAHEHELELSYGC